MSFREQLEQARDGFAQAAKSNIEAAQWITAGENAARAKVIEQILAMKALEELELLAAMSAGRSCPPTENE